MSRKKNAFTNQTQKKTSIEQNIGREITFTLTLTASRVNPYIPAIGTVGATFRTLLNIQIHF